MTLLSLSARSWVIHGSSVHTSGSTDRSSALPTRGPGQQMYRTLGTTQLGTTRQKMANRLHQVGPSIATAKRRSCPAISRGGYAAVGYKITKFACAELCSWLGFCHTSFYGTQPLRLTVIAMNPNFYPSVMRLFDSTRGLMQRFIGHS